LSLLRTEYRGKTELTVEGGQVLHKFWGNMKCINTNSAVIYTQGRDPQIRKAGINNVIYSNNHKL
jgi:hypothetical protein